MSKFENPFAKKAESHMDDADPKVVDALSDYIRKQHPDLSNIDVMAAAGRVIKATNTQGFPLDLASITHMHSDDKEMIDTAVSVELQKNDTNHNIITLDGGNVTGISKSVEGATKEVREYRKQA